MPRTGSRSAPSSDTECIESKLSVVKILGANPEALQKIVGESVNLAICLEMVGRRPRRAMRGEGTAPTNKPKQASRN